MNGLVPSFAKILQDMLGALHVRFSWTLHMFALNKTKRDLSEPWLLNSPRYRQCLCNACENRGADAYLSRQLKGVF